MLTWAAGSSSWGRTANVRVGAPAGVGGSVTRGPGRSSQGPGTPRRTRPGSGSARRARRSAPSRCGPRPGSAPAASWNSPRRRAQTRRMADDPGLGGDVDAHRDRREDLELGRPDEPREAALEVPVAPEPERGRVLPGEILGVPHQARRAEAAVRAGLVEADAVAGLVDERPVHRVGRWSSRRARRRREVVEVLDRDDPGRRRAARSGGRGGRRTTARASKTTSTTPRPLVVVRGVAPGVVELVEDVGARCRGRPTCSRARPRPRPPRP